MIPYNWRFWKRWKRKKLGPKQPKPAELTLNVAIEGHDEFIEKLQAMELAIIAFGAAAGQASEHISAACEKFAVTYNYNITSKTE